MTAKIATSVEQSKKLAEILPLESADMYYPPCVGSYSEYPELDLLGVIDESCLPCWSLAALMNLLPSKFTEKGKYSETTYNIDIRKYALTDDVDVYQIAYGNYHWHEDGSYSWSDMINTGEKENLIDACYEMILKLNEMNLL